MIMSLSCLKISIDSPSPTEYSRRFLSVADKSLPSDDSPAANLQTLFPHANVPPYGTVTQDFSSHRENIMLSHASASWGMLFLPLIPVPFLVTRQIQIKHYHPRPACPRNHQQRGAPLPNRVGIPCLFLSLLLQV